MKDSKKLLSKVRISLLVMSVCVMSGVSLRISSTAGAVPQKIQQLPVSDFLNLLPPLAASVYFDPSTGNRLVIDTYGKRNVFFDLNLGTTVTGVLTVKDHGDGTETVSLNLHTKDAICWGFNGHNQPAFGYRPVDVMNDLGPASLGDAVTRIIYTQPTGPLTLPNDFNTFLATVMCDGELRFGSGYLDGTPGFAQTTQTGLFNTGVPGGCPPEKDADCFPAENVQFKAIGN